MRGPLVFAAALLVGLLVGATLMPVPAAPAPATRPPTPTVPMPSVSDADEIESLALPPRTYSQDGKLGPSRAACASATTCVDPARAPPAEIPLDSPSGFSRVDAVVTWTSDAPAGTPLRATLLACRGSCGPGALVLDAASSPEDRMAPGASRLTLGADLAQVPDNTILVVLVEYGDQLPGAAEAHASEGQAFHVEARLS